MSDHLNIYNCSLCSPYIHLQEPVTGGEIISSIYEGEGVPATVGWRQFQVTMGSGDWCVS